MPVRPKMMIKTKTDTLVLQVGGLGVGFIVSPPKKPYLLRNVSRLQSGRNI
jgi:hypothetical protein